MKAKPAMLTQMAAEIAARPEEAASLLASAESTAKPSMSIEARRATRHTPGVQSTPRSENIAAGNHINCTKRKP